MAVGIYFFKFANNFTFGGITGFAVLVAKFTPLSASDFSFIANMLLLIIGLFVLGKKFAAQTAYSSILLSVTLSGLERIYPMSHPLTNEPLLELIFAIVLPAIGSAILFNIGASSGGTDVIAMILKKYTSVDIGKGLLASDILFTIAGFFEFIKNDLKRGATIVLAQGAFTGDDKYIILTVLSPNEAIKLRNFIKAHTTGAFLLISNTSEIIGKGFHSV